jgi:DNA polymerase-4
VRQFGVPQAEASILHVDMDSFYASVEVREDPSLRGRPVIVGGSGERGVVASCSYEARAHGVRSAMPSVRARRLCPLAVFLPGRYDLYASYSRRIHEVFCSYTPLVEGISLDEAFLDVSGARRLFGPAERIAHAVRADIGAELGLTCSVGVAASKFVAKLASEAAKPRPSPAGPVPGRGVVVVEPGGELAFLHPLPVEALWGVGPATHRRLARFGVRTVGDLAALPVETLVGALGPSLGRSLHELAWARDGRAVEPERVPKSVGHEETYRRDLHDPEVLHREAVRMADAVAARLRTHGLAGRTVTVKVRFHDFRTITRSHTIATPSDTTPALARVAGALLARVDPSAGVRLLGVGVSNLVPVASRQLGLGDAETSRWQRASGAVDEIRRRFGDDAVAPAVLARPGRTGMALDVKRRGDTPWGPADTE